MRRKINDKKKMIKKNEKEDLELINSSNKEMRNDS